MQVGVDVAETKRFARFAKDRRHRFLAATYTPAELAYCFSFKDPAPRLAGTFAAKEAVFKSLKRKNILFSAIEIRREKDGAPGAFLDRRRLPVALSISYAAGFAVAVAIKR